MRPAFAFAFAFALACVGCLPEGIPPESDPLIPDGGGSPPPPNAPDAATIACAPAVASVPSGKHNDGQACMSCHAAGGSGPTWTMGGTLYTPAGAPLAGATIRVTGANGATLTLVTAQNGNFWTTAAVAFPVTVAASRCPDTAQMVAPAANGNCNAGGCHDSTRRIRLP